MHQAHHVGGREAADMAGDGMVEIPGHVDHAQLGEQMFEHTGVR